MNALGADTPTYDLQAQEEQLAAQAVRLSTCQAEADARAQQLLAEHQAYRAAAEATERQLAAELGSSRAAAEQGMQQLQADLEEAQAAAEASMRQLLEEAEASRAAADARQKQVEAVMEGARQVGGEAWSAVAGADEVRGVQWLDKGGPRDGDAVMEGARQRLGHGVQRLKGGGQREQGAVREGAWQVGGGAWGTEAGVEASARSIVAGWRRAKGLRCGKGGREGGSTVGGWWCMGCGDGGGTAGGWCVVCREQPTIHIVGWKH
eukprot:1146791-Pelagomonas_calceolata.AAC.3